MRRSMLVLALAIVFWAFFQAAKQVAFLAGVNPFAEDPYDAVGSFGFQAAGALGALAVVRALGFLTPGDSARLLARTQLASVLAVGITLAADSIALVRHPGFWWMRPGGLVLAGLVVGLACLAAAAGVVCYRAVPRRTANALPAAAVCVIGAFILFFYPEGTRATLLGAVTAIAAGIVLLFVPLRVVTASLIAGDVAEHRRGFPVEWAVVVAVALTIGALVARAEAGAEGGLRPGVALIFIGFELAAVVFGYALMRGPLALTLTAVAGRTPSAGGDRRP